MNWWAVSIRNSTMSVSPPGRARAAIRHRATITRAPPAPGETQMTDARERRLEAHRAFEREPCPGSMGDLLDRAAARFGDHPAFVFFQSGECLTFRELKERVDRLAAALARVGVIKGTHVAL